MPAAARPRLVLHVGAGKAGSSAIQAFLGQHAQQLARNGYIVPGDDLSLKPGTGQQTTYLQRLAPLDDGNVAGVRQRLEKLQRHALRARGSTVIVSAENLLNAGDNHGFIRLFERIDDLFDVLVVAYIRRQDEYITASWAQWYFKTTPDFRTWFEQEAKGKLADWNIALQPWETVFGDSRIVVRVFDRSRLVRGDVVTDFLDVVGIDPTGYGYEAGQLVNPTLNEVATRIAHRNRDLSTGLHDHRFMNFLKTFGGSPAQERVETGLYLSADERRELLALYADSNDRVREKHFPSIPRGGLFPEVADDQPRISSDQQLQMELDLLWNVTYQTYRRLPQGLTRGVINKLSGRARNVGRRR